MARYRGFVSAEKILSELGAEATAAAKAALAHGADDVVAEAKNRCPVYTGTDKRVVKGALRDSIHKTSPQEGWLCLEDRSRCRVAGWRSLWRTR